MRFMRFIIVEQAQAEVQDSFYPGHLAVSMGETRRHSYPMRSDEAPESIALIHPRD